MIVGLGTDVVGVGRIAGVYARQKKRFLTRIFTPDEQAYCLATVAVAERLAGRWAAKEAAMKALGTGWAQGVRFTDIAVLSTAVDGEIGAPRLVLSGAAAAVAARLQVKHSWVSISHSDGVALATVIFEA